APKATCCPQLSAPVHRNVSLSTGRGREPGDDASGGREAGGDSPADRRSRVSGLNPRFRLALTEHLDSNATIAAQPTGRCSVTVQDDRPPLSPADAATRLERALFEIRRVIAGQDAMLERVLVCLLAQGH